MAEYLEFSPFVSIHPYFPMAGGDGFEPSCVPTYGQVNPILIAVGQNFGGPSFVEIKPDDTTVTEMTTAVPIWWTMASATFHLNISGTANTTYSEAGGSPGSPVTVPWSFSSVVTFPGVPRPNRNSSGEIGNERIPFTCSASGNDSEYGIVFDANESIPGSNLSRNYARIFPFHGSDSMDRQRMDNPQFSHVEFVSIWRRTLAPEYIDYIPYEGTLIAIFIISSRLQPYTDAIPSGGAENETNRLEVASKILDEVKLGSGLVRPMRASLIALVDYTDGESSISIDAGSFDVTYLSTETWRPEQG